MNSIELAKEVYITHNSFPGEWRGPYRPFLPPEVYEQYGGGDILGKWETILKEVEQDVENQICYAPSPWHAALFLTPLQWRKREDPWPMLFRGQGDSGWRMSSSLSRLDALKASHAVRASRAFCDLLARYWHLRGLSAATSPNIHMATAQHYGIPTCLLDFTFDASVAVYFAATEREPSNENNKAVVFFIGLNRSWDFGTKVLLPPPAVERVYHQRGLFLEIPEGQSSEFQTMCCRIEFPRDPTFQIVREGQSVDILPGDSWLENITKWVKRHTELKDLPSDQKEWPSATIQELLSFPVPDYLSRGGDIQSQFSWVSSFQEILYWSAIIVTEDKEVFVEPVIEHIAEQNPTIAEFVAFLYEESAIDEYETVRRRLAKTLKDAAQRGSSHTP